MIVKSYGPHLEGGKQNAVGPVPNTPFVPLTTLSINFLQFGKAVDVAKILGNDGKPRFSFFFFPRSEYRPVRITLGGSDR